MNQFPMHDLDSLYLEVTYADGSHNIYYGFDILDYKSILCDFPKASQQCLYNIVKLSSNMNFLDIIIKADEEFKEMYMKEVLYKPFSLENKIVLFPNTSGQVILQFKKVINDS